MNATKNIKCSFCNLSFSHKQCLLNHLSKAHLKEVALELDPKSDLECKHNCTMCGKKFKFLRSLRRHERKSHSVRSPKFKNRLKCPLCEFSTSEKNHFSKHIETKHNITVKTEEYVFQSVNEFNQWKEKVEKETFSRYNKTSGSYKGAENSKRFYYGCHRSGFFVPNAKSKKNLKAKGSKKINGTCPSSIQVLEAEDGTCKVKFVETHVGHENEIFHLYLTEKEKKSIAKDIINGIPFDEILNRVRDSATDSSLSRIHLLTKKDLHNIKRSLNSNSIVVEQSDDDYDDNGDGMIVEECIEEVDVSQDNSVHVICEIITDENGFSYLDGGSQNDNILCLDIENHYDPSGSFEILNKKESEDLDTGLIAKKEKIKTCYLSLLDSAQTEKEFEVFENNLSEIESALKTAQSSKVISGNDSKFKVLQNRIDPQNQKGLKYE